MRVRGKIPPMTAAQRQAKCRAIKRGTWVTHKDMSVPQPPELPIPNNPNLLLTAQQVKAFEQSKSLPALPAPPSTAIQNAILPKTMPALSERAMIGVGSEQGDGLRLSLPPAVAARLLSLLKRHHAGKSLTAAERAEAQGLLDIAEYFTVQRLRNQLAA